jgi:hypothetical protein
MEMIASGVLAEEGKITQLSFATRTSLCIGISWKAVKSGEGMLHGMLEEGASLSLARRTTWKALSLP